MVTYLLNCFGRTCPEPFALKCTNVDTLERECQCVKLAQWGECTGVHSKIWDRGSIPSRKNGILTRTIIFEAEQSNVWIAVHQPKISVQEQEEAWHTKDFLSRFLSSVCTPKFGLFVSMRVEHAPLYSRLECLMHSMLHSNPFR